MNLQRINSVIERLGFKWNLELAFNKDFYWEFSDYIVFSYNSRKYLDEGLIGEALTGNFPLVIDKKGARVEEIYELTPSGRENFQNKDLQSLIENGWIKRII